MPIYEYQCAKCGHKLEALQKMSDEPLLDCPDCEQAALTKLVSAASFRLKGSGWYETDFKTGDKRQLADSGKDEQSKDSKKDSEGASAKEKPAQSPDNKNTDKPKTASKSSESKSDSSGSKSGSSGSPKPAAKSA